MSSLSWKLRQWMRKPMNVVIAAAVGLFGYSMYQNGLLRSGIGPALQRTVRQIPVLGSYFRPSRRSYGYYQSSYARRSRSYGRRYSKGRRYHGSRHHRRHHRR